MSGLQLLIRIARRTVEERQIALAQVRQAREAATAAVQTHEDGIVAECQLAGQSVDALAAFSTWAAAAARLGDTLRQRCAELARSEDAAQGALHEAFVGLKRLELALDEAARSASIAARRRVEAVAEERQRIRSTIAVV